MALKDKITEDLKTAMKSGNKIELESIRAIKKALMEKEITIRQGGSGELTAEQEIQVLTSLAKQRRDSIEQFVSAGRNELAENEKNELVILERYLPQQMSEADAKIEVQKIIAEVGATSQKEIGKVMGVAMKTLKGKIDGTVVQRIAKEILPA